MTRILYAGADIRRHPAQSDDDWTLDRRETFLLRPDVARPLSVDPYVWGGPLGHARGQPGALLPWVSASAMLQRRTTLETPMESVVVVVGAVAADPQEEEAITKATGAAADLVVQPDWKFLGFDIADGETSGLCNCGYTKRELAALRRVWASKLNEHGLFAEIADALAFRQLTDERVPEHAPFHVCGLWMIPV